jgi:inner membrane protein
VDNLTHTLVGAALSEAGLKKRTPLAGATLMIGANFPDIDVIAVPIGYGVEWRRGATHGVLALAILPFVLAGIMWLWDRQVRRRRNPDAPPADYRQLALLSGMAILTHPSLDFMNTYGMRWLMPFVDKWFYADGLFIVDLYVLGALLLGVVWSRRDRITRPARVALAGVAAYTVVMLVFTGFGRQVVGTSPPYPRRYMVAPVPMIPWRRTVLADDGERYHFGSYSLTGGLEWYNTLPKGDRHPAVAPVRQLPEAGGYLGWARFPLYRVWEEEDATVVRVTDERYMSAEWASRTFRLPKGPRLP